MKLSSPSSPFYRRAAPLPGARRAPRTPYLRACEGSGAAGGSWSPAKATASPTESPCRSAPSPPAPHFLSRPLRLEIPGEARCSPGSSSHTSRGGPGRAAQRAGGSRRPGLPCPPAPAAPDAAAVNPPVPPPPPPAPLRPAPPPRAQPRAPRPADGARPARRLPALRKRRSGARRWAVRRRRVPLGVGGVVAGEAVPRLGGGSA